MLAGLFSRIGELMQGREPAPEPQGFGTLRAEVTTALDQEAQKTLDLIDDALTAWQQLELRAERDRKGMGIWREKLARAEAAAASAPAGSADGEVWERLTLDARAEVDGRAVRLEQLQALMEQSRPAVEEALRVVESIGLSREAALSQIDCLQVTEASLEARERLAAARLNGETEGLAALLAGARDELEGKRARVEAVEELASALRDG